MPLSWFDYLDSIEIPYSKMELATDNFSNDNLITQEEEDSSVMEVFEGQLLLSGQFIHIEAHKFQQPDRFVKEVEISYVLHQKNLTSVVKISGKDVEHMFVAKKKEANGSLDKHITASTLTWLQRLHICLGIADALSCLHYNDIIHKNYCYIHGEIKSSKILLDHNWVPKLHASQFSVHSKRNHLQLTSKHMSTLQYMDPVYETTGGFTHKSDVFSFGVLLFEVLFQRIAFTTNDDNWCFARLARLHFEEGRLKEMINPDLRKQMDLQSLKIFSETAFFCLKEERQQRPEMKTVVKRLVRTLELQRKHENPEQSTIAADVTSSRQLKGKNLDDLRIPLGDIISATENFSEAYCIGKGGYGKVYKAELTFRGRNSLVTERKNKDEMSINTTCTTVAIKRISKREDKHGEEGFLAEIEMLSNCRHTNIISLLGFCDEDPEMIIVYEYACNHSLDDYFENDDNIVNLTWAQRVQICLDIAHGLQYLHTPTKDKQKIIHRDIKSANVLLDDNWVAKIADFGLSKLHIANQQGSTLMTSTIAGTEVYLDPEYMSTGKLKRASDIYSFGVVMFEIFFGRLAYARYYNEKLLPSIVRERFIEGTLKEMVDPKIKEVENIFMLNRNFHQKSLDNFLKIAYQCLYEAQSKRPSIEIIIEELQKAYDLQKNFKDDLQISLEAIKLATGNFNENSCIEEGRFWKQYEGELGIVKRWDNKFPQGYIQFLRELEVLSTNKHGNIIGIVGYCKEKDEKVIVYEHSSNGRLDKHLDNPSLTWLRRLNICIDIASGINFLHANDGANEFSWIHRDIKSRSILLGSDWKAKLCNLELSSNAFAYEECQHLIDNSYGSLNYLDPEYKDLGSLRKESDIYSLGVVLMEIMCGRLARADECEDPSQTLGPLAKRHYEEGTLDELVYEGIRDQITPQSLLNFQMIAYRCLDDDSDDRPDPSAVVKNLKEALEFQEDLEIWEPKLPRDYKEIMQLSKSPEIYSTKTKKDLCNMLTKGILLQKSKLWFSLGTNGERNEMISAKYLYENPKSHNWLSIQTSRFQKVALMSDISKLKTQIKIKTRFLSPGVNYRIYLVFKFLNSEKHSRPMYVNLTYKMRSETLHSYFATWRDDEWMMLELGRCFIHNKETDFEVQLESFSRCYCTSSAIYVEGIQFREIYNAEHEQIEKSKTAEQESPTNSKKAPKRSQSYDDGEEIFLQSKVNEKKNYFLYAKEALYDSSNAKVYNLKPSDDSRFKEVIEILAQQLLHIKCKIESQMLLQDTEYACYLVFKLSEKCCGLHCPVRVKDLLCWNNRKTEILYFRSPSSLNRHNTNRIPKTREDGCKEVSVWEGNVNDKFRNGFLPLNLKLVSYEGNMSGLIVYGLEFRPM